MRSTLLAGIAVATSLLASVPARAQSPSCHVVQGRSSSFTWCENRITRLSHAERVARLMPEPIRPGPHTTPAIPPSSWRDLPDGTPSDPVFDWHDVGGDNWMTGVRDQAGCGSCFVFGALGALESQMKVATGNPLLDVDLSEQSVISCISLGSCDSGGTAEEVGIRLKSEGATDEACYPYLADDGSCDDLCSDWKDRRFRIDDWHMSVLPWSDDDIKDQLVRTPIIAQMQVYTDFYGYKSGVYSRSDSADADGWHIVTLVGWDDTDDSWIARNSWGDDWGNEGYFKISRDTDCSVLLKGACFALHVNYFDVDPDKVPGMPCLEQSSISLFALEGEQDEAQVDVTNCGLASWVDVAWETDASWLSAMIADETLIVGGATQAKVVASAASIEPGVHEGEIRFVGGPGVSTLHVTFEVEALPEPEPPPVEPSPEAGVPVPSQDAGADAGPDAPEPVGTKRQAAEEEDGCGCRAAGAPSRTGGIWLLALAAFATLRRRNR